jgi:hypothetical protein
MTKNFIPNSIRKFTEYIKNAYQKALENLSNYGIPSEKLAVITPLYDDYIAKEALAGNPETATKGNREARNEAKKILEKEWRQFLNENVRFNKSIGTADKEVFGISPRDNVRTSPLTPTATGNTHVKRLGAFEYEITVTDGSTSKRKLPEYAAGSFLYLAISEPGVLPKDIETYRKLDFSSKARHNLRFSPSDLAKQANIYVRYANRQGKEGPAGQIETFLIN